MASRVFIDILNNEGGRVYVFDRAEGRLTETFPMSMDEEMRVTLDKPLPEDMELSCMGLPLSWLDFRMLELDLKDSAAARAVLPFELDGLVLGNPEDYVIDAVMREGAEGVLAAYMNRHRLSLLLASLEAVGLDPVAVTSLELASCVDRLFEGDMTPVTDGNMDLPEPRRVDLALGEFDSPVLDLRIGELAYTGDVRRGIRRMAGTLALFVSLLLVLALALGLGAMKSSREAAQLESGVLALYTEIFPGQKPETARGLSYKVRSKLNELRKKADGARGIEALEALASVQAAMPEGLKALEITMDEKNLLIKGEGPDLKSIEALRSALESASFGEVKITETGKAVSGQTGFTIRADVAGGKRS